jgi:O-antigen ligase
LPRFFAAQVALLVSSLKGALDQRIGIDDYLVWSTVVSALLFVPVMQSVFLGYLLVILNSLILLVFDRLAIHRDHLLAILLLSGFSLVGAHFSGTEIKPIVMQIVGITVLSVYYLNALTTFGISLSRWMEMYVRVAFVMALLGIMQWFASRLLHVGDGRLHSIYLEPSHYIFVVLPAIGYCVGRYAAGRQYGSEALIFLLTFVLADSSLGFIGLLLIGIFIITPKLKGWQIFLASALVCGVVGALFAGSENFRVRATDTVMAIATQDLGGTNASTFALLSNVYVTGQSFLAHPLTGVGIGGYAKAYDTYIGTLVGPNLVFLQENLNRDDANSLFLRVAAELGVPGLVVLFGFLIICAQVKGAPYRAIRNAVLPYLLIRMGRFGAYFSVEFYFFVGIYVLNYMQSREAKKQAIRSET